MSTTRAVVFTARNEVQFREVSAPDPGPEDVLVRTCCSWISNGTEGSFLRCERVDGITPWRPGMEGPFPMVPGYQKVGVIEWVGDAARHRKPDLREGQMVFATMTRCEGMRFPSGGHVERGPVPVSEVFRLPETAYPEAFAGAVLTQVGYNAGSRPPLEPGDPFLVIGDGLVGHWSAQTLRLRGARVAMLGRHQYRLDRFETGEHGLRLWAGAEDWRERLKEWAGGELAGLVDTVGNHTNMDQNLTLIGLIRRCGQYVTVGHHGPKPLDLCPFIRRELTLHCPAGWSSARLGATLQLIAAEELSTLSLVTHRFPASAVAEAWSLIEAKKDETLGVLLEW